MAFPKIIKAGRLEKKVLTYTTDEHNLQLVNHEEFQKYVEEKMKEIELLKEKAQSASFDIKDKAEAELRQAREQSRTILLEARKEEQKIFSQREEELTKQKKETERKLDSQLQELEARISRESSDIEERRNSLRKEIQKELYEAARKEGLRDIREEYTRLIERIQNILGEAVKAKANLLYSLEKELNSLVMMIVAKVIKRIGETDRLIISSVVVEALKKLRGRDRFTIKVNLLDLENVRKEIPSIVKKLELGGMVTVVEDSGIESGGCIIETELGSLDAQLSSQLREIERSIRETELLSSVRE